MIIKTKPVSPPISIKGSDTQVFTSTIHCPTTRLNAIPAEGTGSPKAVKQQMCNGGEQRARPKPDTGVKPPTETAGSALEASINHSTNYSWKEGCTEHTDLLPTELLNNPARQAHRSGFCNSLELIPCLGILCKWNEVLQVTEHPGRWAAPSLRRFDHFP